MKKPKITLIGGAALAVSALVILSSCSSGVAQSDYNNVKNQLTTAQQQLTAAQQQVTGLQQQLNDAKGAALITAQKPASGGAPPPAPQGPTPTPPASLYQSVGPFFCNVQTLTAGAPGPGGLVGSPVCAVSGVFKLGENVVWRFDILNVSTGKLVTDQDAAKVTIELPNGASVPAAFNQRGGGMAPDAPWSWEAAFQIPTNYPVGSLPYSISITLKDGTTGTWTPEDINIPPAHVSSQIQIVN